MDSNNKKTNSSDRNTSHVSYNSYDSYDKYDSDTYNESISILPNDRNSNSNSRLIDTDDAAASIYKYRSTLIILALLSAAGMLAMSMNRVDYSTKPSSSWKSNFLKSRISLAKQGVIDYSDLSSSEKAELFDDFKKTYKKEYDSDNMEETSFQNFKSFLKRVDMRNKDEADKGGSAVHGVTIFADLSDDDFKSAFLGFKEVDDRRLLNRSLRQKHDKRTLSKKDIDDTYKNWAEDGYTTSVRDQGYCGSCWAISAVQQVESDAIITGLMTNKEGLSVQQVVSCDKNDYACSGGNTETAYTYIGKTGGLELESVYPYTSYYAKNGHCTSNEDKYKITVQGYHTVDDEDDMEEYVLKKGPLSVCLAASSWSSYQSGVVSSCDKAVDHCVQIVGVDTDNEYWIVRNSWGTEWGDKGYIYLKTGQNTCYITYDPTYTSVKAVKDR